MPERGYAFASASDASSNAGANDKVAWILRR